MNNDDFTWLGALSVFWALTWRTLIIGVPLAMIIGGIIGFVGYTQGVEQDQIATYGGIVAQFIVIPVYVYVIRRLFTKGFGKYRLQVVEKE